MNIVSESLAWAKENMAKKIEGKKENTFSILYRSGSIHRETGMHGIEIPDTHFTGKFTEDISDYFKNRLVEGGIDITDEIAIRTSPVSWSIYFEVYYGLVQIEGKTITTNDLFNNYTVDFVTPCQMKCTENIPMCLFDKFNIIHYPEWGEVVMFNHDKLKSELLDTLVYSSTETMQSSYQEILDIIQTFSNPYNMLSERLIDLAAKKPIELRREENRILQLRTTDEFKRLLKEKRTIVVQEPNPDDEGVFIIENGRHVKGPNYESWKRNRDEWVTSYKTWFNNIDHDYKLCFKACYEKLIILHGEYLGRDFQFPGFIMSTNISGTVQFNV